MRTGEEVRKREENGRRGVNGHVLERERSTEGRSIFEERRGGGSLTVENWSKLVGLTGWLEAAEEGIFLCHCSFRSCEMTILLPSMAFYDFIPIDFSLLAVMYTARGNNVGPLFLQSSPVLSSFTLLHFHL